MTTGSIHLFDHLAPASEREHLRRASARFAPSKGATVDRLHSLHSVLAGLVYSHSSRQDFLTAIVDLARSLTDARSLAYFQAHRGGTDPTAMPLIASTAFPEAERYVELMRTSAEAAHAQQRLTLHRLESGLVVMSVSVRISADQVDALCAVFGADVEALETVALALQLAASQVTLWHALQSSRALDREAANSAAVLEMIGAAARCASVSAAARSLVDETSRYLGCDRGALGTVAPGAKLCRLTTVSGVAGVDPQANLSSQFEAVLNEALLRNTPGCWPPAPGVDRHLLCAHRQLSEACGGKQIISAKLCDAAGTPVGAWAFLVSADGALDANRAGFLGECAGEVGAILDLVRRTEDSSKVQSLFRRLSFWRTPRSRLLWITAMLACVCLAAPLHYRVSCQCVIEPVARRFVAAPFDGVFEKSLVKPGDLVQRDQPLGRLDGRDLRVEMAGFAADYSRAAKSRDVNLAAGKIAAAQIDKLEMERLDQRKRLLTRRLEHLEIKSPIEGVVISGDLQRSEGVPVSVGQVLYEVAPLDQMVAEVAVADRERSYVQEDQSVTIRLDAFPGSSWSDHVARITPRSELRNDDNVFIAEATLDNADRALRPGMKGEAKIESARYPLAWIILHKPWNALLHWMGW